MICMRPDATMQMPTHAARASHYKYTPTGRRGGDRRLPALLSSGLMRGDHVYRLRVLRASWLIIQYVLANPVHSLNQRLLL
jgi:hypothetical protein